MAPNIEDGRYSLEDTGSDSKTLLRDAARVEPLLYTPKPILPAANKYE